MKNYRLNYFEHSTLIAGLIAKGTGALYGVFAMMQFSQTSNLNLWIISGYIPSIIVLANVIIVPDLGHSINQSELITRITKWKLVSSSPYRRRRNGALFSHFMILALLLIQEPRTSERVSTIIIFTLQGLQIPILLRLLMRNERTYFSLSRTAYITVTMVGNLCSLLTVFVYFITSTPIDDSTLSVSFFIAMQLLILSFQDLFYAKYINYQEIDFPIRQTIKRKIGRPKIHFSIRMYLFLPCAATLVSFVNERQNEEIASVFLGLNILTMLTYLGLPNDKLHHEFKSRLEIYSILKLLLIRSFSIFVLVLILLNIFVTFLDLFQLTPEFLMPSGLKLVTQLSFLGIFLMPIIALENNKSLHSEHDSWHMNCTIFALIATYVVLLIRDHSSLMESISVSFVSSYIVWYTIALVKMFMDRKHEV